MTNDVEVPVSQALDGDRPDEQPTAEAALRVTLVKSVVLAVPLSIAVFVGLVALAVRNQQPDWNAYLAMAAGIGVVAGVFFGLLIGFTLSSHNFQ